MATRLLPFRQYDENDVVNLYSYDGEALNLEAGPTTSSAADAGVLVKVTAANLDSDFPNMKYDSLGSVMGYQAYPHMGKNGYPEVPWRVQAAGSGEAVLGITLKQTVLKDENGEKLLHYPQKKDELQAVNSGEAVPVATRGLFMVDSRAVNDSLTVGTKLSCHAAGKFGAFWSGNYDETDVAREGDAAVGTCIGVGTASGDHVGSTTSANYYLIQLNPAAS
jgi:hypothetical protein